MSAVEQCTCGAWSRTPPTHLPGCLRFVPTPTEAAWPPPTRFDPDDRDTWPEDGQRVLVWWADEWTTIGFVLDDGTPAWVDVDGAVDEVTPGDLWLPGAPTPEVQG